jgi:hypothetical protein
MTLPGARRNVEPGQARAGSLHRVPVCSLRFNVTIAFDVNTKAAAAERLKLFAQAAKNRTMIAGAHLPFPGLGYLRAEGRGYS